MNYAQINELANAYTKKSAQFLRDIIAIPSTSCNEGPVIERIAQEMNDVGFDEVIIDPMGNILGRIGSGKHIIAMDGHVDTVGVGNPVIGNMIRSREKWKVVLSMVGVHPI